MDGLSATAIAKLLPGRTKNAIIGKVHRLGLSLRTNPIRRRQSYFPSVATPKPVKERRVVSHIPGTCASCGGPLSRKQKSACSRQCAGTMGPQHSDEVREAVRRMWLDEPGTSAPEIGRRVGLTKRQVLELRIRMGLPGRHPGITLNARKIGRPTLVVPMKPLALPGAPYSHFHSCQWPLNDGRPWRFCGADAVAGRSYCGAHCRMAYARRQEAA
jgi:GcrA cell cycle regulator